MLSRRKLIATGIATGAATLLQARPAGAARVGQASSLEVGSVEDFVSVTSPSSPGFASKLEELFPGLLKDPYFQKIQSHSVLISNIGSKPINAYSTHWAVGTASGGYEAMLLHYFHPTSRRPRAMHFGVAGNKTRFTGQIPAIKAGSTRLVTPYFNWSPTYYRNNPKPDWKKILSASASRQFFLQEIAKSTSVQVTVDAVIVDHSQVIGQDRAGLGAVYSTTRNAERDEASQLLGFARGGSSRAQMLAVVSQHASVPPPARDGNHLYNAVRIRQAAVLLRRLNKARPEQFTRTLEYISSKPVTTISSQSSVKGA